LIEVEVDNCKFSKKFCMKIKMLKPSKIPI